MFGLTDRVHQFVVPVDAAAVVPNHVNAACKTRCIWSSVKLDDRSRRRQMAGLASARSNRTR